MRRALPLCSLVLTWALAGCATNSNLPQDRADRYFGQALTGFGGADGADVDLQALAQQLCAGREYDFTPVGFQIAETAAALTLLGHADPRFAGGNGALEIVEVNRDDNTETIGDLSLTVQSNDPRVSGVKLDCRFNLNQAQNAINTPGISFAVNWRISFTLDGAARTLTADQVLYGIDFRST